MLNKLTYFVQREPVTPVKRKSLLFHSLRTTLNSSATTHPIVSKYTVTVKIKNTWVWNTSHTNTAHLLANTKANVMKHLLWASPEAQTPRAGSENAPSHSPAQEQWAFLIHLLPRAAAGHSGDKCIPQPPSPAGNPQEPPSLILHIRVSSDCDWRCK